MWFTVWFQQAFFSRSVCIWIPTKQRAFHIQQILLSYCVGLRCWYHKTISMVHSGNVFPQTGSRYRQRNEKRDSSSQNECVSFVIYEKLINQNKLKLHYNNRHTSLSRYHCQSYRSKHIDSILYDALVFFQSYMENSRLSDLVLKYLSSFWRQQFLNSGPVLLQGLANDREKERKRGVWKYVLG